MAALDLAKAGKLEFEAVDLERFPCVRLAYEALERGGTAPAVLNAANEIAVAAFLNGRIAFLDIVSVVEETLTGYRPNALHSLTDLFSIDAAARAYASGQMDKLPHAA